MTGFGVGRAPFGGGRVEIEIRAVNHRFLEIRISAGAEIGARLHAMESRLRRKLVRGRYDVAVRFSGATPLTPRLDRVRAAALLEDLKAIRDQVAPDTPLELGALLQVPELLTTEQVDEEALDAALATAIDAALDELDAMRRTEGWAVAKELGRCLAALREHHAAVEQRAAGLVRQQRQRLRKRLERLLADVDVTLDEGRLEAEVAVLADRADVTEELARWSSHLDQLSQLLGSDGEVGRRIDFLLQEIHREVNTLGSKSQDADVASRVVEAKAEIERMRQQAANIA
ncbi:MAG: YicC family protein [Myxococcales bacterium]|nr:YicC family protein [Myxococcales bacterium]